MAISLVGPLNSGAAAGSNGSATNNTDSTRVITGIVRALCIVYNDSPPAGTTDVTVATKGTVPGVSETIYYKADSATDGWFYPKTLFNLNTTGAAISSLYEFIPISDYVNIKIEGANAADSVDVWILLEN